MNEYGALKRVALRHPRDAFQSRAAIDRSWRDLGYPTAPDLDRAGAEFDDFAGILSDRGARIDWLPDGEALSLDSLYVRDATLVSPRGLIACNMGKPARAAEPALAQTYYDTLDLPLVGRIDGEGRLEGGDLVWLDEATCLVGHTYRTNEAGIAQLRALLGPDVEVVVSPLPHYRGPADVFHLMSILSPLDADLALVYSPLMPIITREWLLSRGLSLVEVPDEEFESMACNVLALGPRDCLMIEGNPVTQGRLEAAGCRVTTYVGREISAKGAGGPTCLTRPLVRG